MRRNLIAGIIYITSLILSSNALHATGIIDISTGQTPVPSGPGPAVYDPIWTIFSAPSGNSSGPAVEIGNPIWPTAPANTHWIATDPADPGGGFYSGGDYIFQTILTGEGILSFTVKADNFVKVLLNGTTLMFWGDASSPAGWTAFSPVQTVTTAPGNNILELDLHNSGSYTGVLLQGTFDAPESGTWILLASGFGFMVLRMRYLCRAERLAT